MGSLDSNPMAGPKGLLCAPGVRGKNMAALSKDSYSLTDYMQSIIFKRQEIKDPFYVLDLGEVAALMDKWTRTLPMVDPFYAVKCNPEPALLGCLAALGSNFDCASPAEIEAVLSLGVSPDRIVYANPCKAETHIKYAASVGVDLTTFDTKNELEKMHRLHPKSDLLIRIKAPDDNGVRCPLGPKYGALPEEVEPLLQAAKAAGLSVVGVSFHVGSGGTHSWEYGTAIAAAKSVFETAVRLGMPRMKVLNIGGGFTFGKQFEEAAGAIKAAFQAYFSDEPGLRVISEPGRILSETAAALVTNIIGKRVRGQLREYWVNDGIYGSMNCILHDRKTLTCSPFACTSNPANPTCDGSSTFTSTVFGPTCDALDTVVKNHQLPELELDDWLVFPNMGAYTLASGSNFNGFNTASILTYLACSNPNHV